MGYFPRASSRPRCKSSASSDGPAPPVARGRAAAAPPLVVLLLVFFGGVVSSAGPCVLAAVPLVVATVGGGATSRGRAVALTLAFVTGLALCFTALGAIAALTRSLIGDVGWVWKALLAAVLIVMGPTSRA